jgi:hypothetical protein
VGYLRREATKEKAQNTQKRASTGEAIHPKFSSLPVLQMMREHPRG